LIKRNPRSLKSSTNKPKAINYTAMGITIGTGIALLLSELGLEVDMSVGFGFGLAIGAYLDKHKNKWRV
jgi:hypothetical protein